MQTNIVAMFMLIVIFVRVMIMFLTLGSIVSCGSTAYNSLVFDFSAIG